MENTGTYTQNIHLKHAPLILHSSDDEMRYIGSSGGVVSAIIRYAFEKGIIQNAISYEFTKNELFKPKLVSSYEEYQIVGSIYHDVGLIKFLKDKAHEIKGKTLVVCLPCQVETIRKCLTGKKVESFIIALTCSAQMSKQATRFLFKKYGIVEEDIEYFRYRGNGWPSGIQIKTRTNKYFFHNTKSIWADIFNSHLFTLKRCFSCKNTFGLKAEISVADPWLKKYITANGIGNTLVFVNTDDGKELIQEALQAGALGGKKKISHLEAIKSQDWTLKRKYVFRKYRTLLTPVLKVIQSKIYIFLVSHLCLIRIHTRVFNKALKLLLKLEKNV